MPRLRDPHPIFVIIFVGDEEKPFGIQKDFLCAKSRYFRRHFYGSQEGSRPRREKSSSSENGGQDGPEDDAGEEKSVEHVVHLPDVAVGTFAHAQHFLYTGQVVPDPDKEMPSYDTLVSIWKLGHRLGIEGLCERTLEAMAENKRLTQAIPATHILVQVWKETPEGSSIRQLLLSWAAEYLRSSQERRAEFARSLPQELLSELVVAMSSSYGDFWATPNAFQGEARPGSGGGGDDGAGTGAGNSSGKHYRDKSGDGYDDGAAPQDGIGADGTFGSIVCQPDAWPPALKRPRYFDSYPLRHAEHANGDSGSGGASALSPAVTPSSAFGGAGGGASAAVPGRKAAGRTSLPTQRVFSSTTTKKRSSHAFNPDTFTQAQKLLFCSDLVTRMLSGPGFWTRLVGPFREPVDPVVEGIPDYPNKVKRPMDLTTIKRNLDRGIYDSPDEFVADVRQIFANVYAYWKPKDGVYQVCERLEKTFEEKYSQMNKWISKQGSEEA